MAAPDQYVLGHSDAELERLQLQAEALEPLTRRLIQECGISPGMRVLDLGTGAGDVAFLVAEAVGPSGSVVGVDREERALLLARKRAVEAQLDNVAFEIGDDERLPTDAPFDAVVGRLVLHHQPDPVATVRRSAEVVRSGGVVAFLEPALHVDGYSFPKMELQAAAAASLFRFSRAALPSPDIAGRMIPCFVEAGLPEPRVLWEAIVPGSRDIYRRWFVSTFRTLLPHMERLGTLDPRVGDPDTLFERLAAEKLERPVQSVGPHYASAWSVKP